MKKNILYIAVAATFLFTACKKDSDGDGVNYGNDTNTWTFTEGSKTYKGTMLFDASLNTLLQGNNSYTYSMIGPEKESGFFFNVVLSLTDLNFTNKNYQSGISGNDHLNAFYYFQDFVGIETYKSSNNDPGEVMNFTVTNYNSSSDIVTFTFSGQARTAAGGVVSITNGKFTVKNERL